jgi:hypothetical protein
MGRRQGNIERKTILALNKLLNLIVVVRANADQGVVDASVESASAAVESLKQLYLADRKERKTNLEAFGFDFNKAEDPS